MKKILTVGLVFLAIFLIYLANIDNKVYYVALGESLEKIYIDEREVYGYSYYVKKYLKDKDLLERYSDDFSKIGTRSTDIIRDINDNKKVTTSKGKFSLKNALIKADLVSLNVDYEDVYDKLSNCDEEIYDYIDDLAYDLDKLFELIREYCKEDIVFIGPYNPFDTLGDDAEDVIEYLNYKYKAVCNDYDILYVDISDITSLSDDSLKSIGDKVIFKMSKSLFEG